MTEPESFAEIIISEAVSNRLRVDLVLKPVTPGTDNRLISMFLGISDDNGVVLSVPWTGRNEKVFVPLWWEMGLAFELGDLWIQTRSEVVGHCQFLVNPTCRVDALVLAQPSRILSMRAGRRRRHEIDPSTPMTVLLWPASDSEQVDSGRPYTGQLVNWSEGGLCVRISQPPRFKIGEILHIRLQTSYDRQCPLLRGAVKHCTSEKDGFWRVGLGEVQELRHGQVRSFSGQCFNVASAPS